MLLESQKLLVVRCALNKRVEGDQMSFFIDIFLVACYATLHPALSVRPSVRRSVTLYFFGIYGVFGYTASAQILH